MRRFGILLALMATLTATAVAETACTYSSDALSEAPSRLVHNLSPEHLKGSCMSNGVCCYIYYDVSTFSCVATKIKVDLPTVGTKDGYREGNDDGRDQILANGLYQDVGKYRAR